MKIGKTMVTVLTYLLMEEDREWMDETDFYEKYGFHKYGKDIREFRKEAIVQYCYEENIIMNPSCGTISKV